MSQEQTNIVLGGRGVRRKRSDGNTEKAIVFHNFLKVSQGLLASIVESNIHRPYLLKSFDLPFFLGLTPALENS